MHETLASSLERGIGAGRAAFGLGDGGTLLSSALLVSWVAATLSAVMDNIPFVAVSTPIIGALIPQLPGESSVLWWALALGACLGGNATPITFREFMRTGVPVTVASLGIAMVWRTERA